MAGTLLGIAASMFGLAAAVAAEPPGRPNIMLIVADDLGYGELGCYGQQIIRTPRLDQLAEQGIRLTQFYAGNAVCAPSRCCLMTGKHPGHAVVRDNQRQPIDTPRAKRLGLQFPGQYPVPTSEPMLSELMQNAGFATAAFGKWGLGHWGSSGDPNERGFGLFYGYNSQFHAHNHYPNFLWRNRTKEVQPGNDRGANGETYSQDQFITEACDFIEEHRREPFFVYMPLAVPHLSIQVPPASLKAYEGVIEEAPYEHRGYIKHPNPRAAYAAMVTHMDAGIGRFIDRIDELGLGEETLILFTSDNGPTYDRLGGSDSDYFNSTAGLKGYKGQLDEGGIRVPLIARQTGQIAPGRTSDWVGAWWDLMPTLLDATAIDCPPVDGISFLSLLRDDQPPANDRPLYWEFAGYGGQQAVRSGRWKAIRKGLNPAGSKNKSLAATRTIEFELYDLIDDPSEERNVAGDHPEIVARLAAIAKQEHTASDEFVLPAIDELRN